MRRVVCALLAGVLVAGAFAEETPSPEKLSRDLAASDVAVRRTAAYELGRLGMAARPALPALIKALDDPDKQVWSSAVTVIATLGPEARDAIPALIDDLDTSGKRGRRQRESRQMVMRSAHALARIGPAAVPALLEALKDEDAGLRAGAAYALGEIGSEARPAIPLLIDHLGDGREPVREQSALALGQIGPEAGPPLVAALADGDARRRAGAARAFAEMKPLFREAGAAVEQALGSEKDSTVRVALISAVPKLGLEADRALALLLPALADDDEAQRHAALNGVLGSRALRSAALARLTALSKDGDPAVRERANRALGRFGGDAGSSSGNTAR